MNQKMKTATLAARRQDRTGALGLTKDGLEARLRNNDDDGTQLRKRARARFLTHDSLHEIHEQGN